MSEGFLFAPVRVTTDSQIHEIGTIREAVHFLRRWPSERRGPVYGCAMDSCEGALAGQLSIEQARQAFASFARIAGILAKEDLVASTLLKKSATRAATHPVKPVTGL